MTTVEASTGRAGAVRMAAVGGPVLLLAYGILRLIDGRDGDHGPGFWWNAGHVAFLVGMLMFGLLGLGLRSLVPGRVADAAAVAVVLGTVAFGWVILGDLFSRLDDTVPDPVMALGPILFQVGLLTLLVLLVVRKQLPVWSPVLVLLGFVPIAVNLDLLPLGAVLIGAGLSRLVVR